MKTKILLTGLALLSLTAVMTATDNQSSVAGVSNANGGQKVVVRSYLPDNGYEYSSRIRRFHNSYVSFDFYSPVYTEVYWYNYRPYTWGVSIYDDWYYYGGAATRYTWRNGFGGSYWWGFEPWQSYDPWMGYGWNPWYNPGVSIGINFYLGRPYYHYPVTWNRWHYGGVRNHSGPVYIINNNNYYYSSARRTDNNTRNREYYNPPRVNDSGQRSGYTVTGGRSTTGQTNNGTSAGSTVNNGRTQQDNGRTRSNNGLRMGQYRRGVAEPTVSKPNQPARTNNPNVYDRTNPGREKETSTENRRSGNTVQKSNSSTNRSNGNSGNSSASRSTTVKTETGTRTQQTSANKEKRSSTVTEKPAKVSEKTSEKSDTNSKSTRRSNSAAAKK